MIEVAALFVDGIGVYNDLFRSFDVDVWDRFRDARRYDGPWPVVAHPPCERWGRYWFGGPSARVRRVRGDDGGCFASALASVRKWGGVLEHPADSSAFEAFGIARPDKAGGWLVADDVGGHVCHVEQAHYGHRARKATWLYAVPRASVLPALKWGRAMATHRIDGGSFHTSEERAAAKALGWREPARMGERERAASPVAFRDLLLSIARGARA